MDRGVSLTHRAFHTAGEAYNLTQLLRLLDFARSALARVYSLLPLLLTPPAMTMMWLFPRAG